MPILAPFVSRCPKCSWLKPSSSGPFGSQSRGPGFQVSRGTAEAVLSRFTSVHSNSNSNKRRHNTQTNMGISDPARRTSSTSPPNPPPAGSLVVVAHVQPGSIHRKLPAMRHRTGDLNLTSRWRDSCDAVRGGNRVSSPHRVRQDLAALGPGEVSGSNSSSEGSLDSFRGSKKSKPLEIPRKTS